MMGRRRFVLAGLGLGTAVGVAMLPIAPRQALNIALWGSGSTVDGADATGEVFRHPSRLRLAWRGRWTAPSGGGGMQIIDGRLILWSADGAVEARDPTDNSLLWATSIQGAGSRNPHSWRLLRSAAGVIVASSDVGHVIAVNPHNGRQAWRGQASPDIRLMAAGDGIVAMVDDNRLIVLDGQTGASRWQSEPLRSDPGALLVGQGLVIVHHRDGTLVAFEKVAGAIRWIEPDFGTTARLWGMAAGILVLTTGSGLLKGLALDNGARLWRSPIGRPVTTVLVSTMAVAEVPGRRLVAVSTESGETLWARETAEDGQPATLDLGAGWLARLGTNGRLRLFDPANGQLHDGRRLVGDRVHAVAGTRTTLVVMMADGELRGYRPRDDLETLL